jgi:hypothetical protein
VSTGPRPARDRRPSAAGLRGRAGTARVGCRTRAATLGRAVALGLLVALQGAAADPTPAQAAEKAELRAEREAVEARYRTAERDCRERLLVSSCLRDAQQRRREALDALRERELVLDDAIRRAEAEEHARRRAAKADAAAQAASAGAARAGADPASAPAGAAAPAARASAPDTSGWRRGEPRAKPASPLEREAQRAAAAAERAAAQQRRASEAQAHREAVERRNADRAAKGRTPAAPLPVPASAPVSGPAD